jgi:aconitate hydratase 2/2-methylisocitrate dehydratase
MAKKIAGKEDQVYRYLNFHELPEEELEYLTA